MQQQLKFVVGLVGLLPDSQVLPVRFDMGGSIFLRIFSAFFGIFFRPRSVFRNFFPVPGGSKKGRKGGREGGKEGRKEGGRQEGRKEDREGKGTPPAFLTSSYANKYISTLPSIIPSNNLSMSLFIYLVAGLSHHIYF